MPYRRTFICMGIGHLCASSAVDTYRKEPGVILETERLALRQFGPHDALFIIDLLNDPDWLTNIGDRDVHSVEQAVAYLEAGPMTMYTTFGFGPYVVERKERSRSDWHVWTLQARVFGGCRHRVCLATGVSRRRLCTGSSAGRRALCVVRSWHQTAPCHYRQRERAFSSITRKAWASLRARMIPYPGATGDVRLFAGTLVRACEATM